MIPEDRLAVRLSEPAEVQEAETVRLFQITPAGPISRQVFHDFRQHYK